MTHTPPPTTAPATPTPAALGAADRDRELDAQGVRSRAIRAFVHEWAEHTQAARIELVHARDDARLLREALEAGEIAAAGPGRYAARSHVRDTARSEERTVVATDDPADRGVYNNWRPATETRAALHAPMRGASRGKTMYVIPYLMAPPGSPLDRWAAGVELTDDRTVALHMLRMARVGLEHVESLADETGFVRAVHVTGDLDHLGQGTRDDQRLFATLPAERTILHYGSAYGGNALLGKIAHGLRQASFDGERSGEFLAEQFLLLAITDTHTGRTWHVCGGFPSASGKTNLAMTLPPDALGARYRVEFYGDDITWLWVDDDGRLRGLNPEFGAFGVIRDTNERTNPTAIAAIAPGSGTIFTNVAHHEPTGEVWWEGKTPAPPSDLDGWRDWTGTPVADRTPAARDAPWAHPNARFTTTLANVSNLAADAAHPEGVPIDAIISGGRTRDREPLVRALDDLADGVYDGLTLGAEATFAAEGLDGRLRYDPMSMRPFFSIPEGPYAAHWLRVLERAVHPPVFAHVNWFLRDESGDFVWPGFRENLRALVWLLRYREGEVTGRHTPVGVVPEPHELDLAGLDLDADAIARLLRVDAELWRAELARRREHLAQFAHLLPEIHAAHARLEAGFAREPHADPPGARPARARTA